MTTSITEELKNHEVKQTKTNKYTRDDIINFEVKTTCTFDYIFQIYLLHYQLLSDLWCDNMNMFAYLLIANSLFMLY